MKFLGASIFKSDGFQFFITFLQIFFFNVKKSLKICCVKEKEKVCLVEERSRRWEKTQMHCKMRRNRCKLLLKVRRVFTGHSQVLCNCKSNQAMQKKPWDFCFLLVSDCAMMIWCQSFVRDSSLTHIPEFSCAHSTDSIDIKSAH